MAQVGFQDYWVAGSRLYFQRDPVDTVVQPMLDIGTIATVNPNVASEQVTLMDPDGGVQTSVDQALISIDESYDITMNNMGLENLALMWLSTAPEDFTQSAVEKDIEHTLIADRLIKIHDDDSSETNVYGLSAIAGIYSGALTSHVVTDISAASRTITLNSTTTLADGDAILVRATGLANIANSQTYTVDGVHSVQTVIAVRETPPANEASITGAAETGAGVLKVGVEFDVVSVDRGFAKLVPGGGVASGDYQIIYSTAALSGNRLIKPQTVKGAVTGKAILIYSRRNNADQTVREMEVSVTPNSSNIQDADFSNIVLTFKVLNDLSVADSAGRLLQFKGSLPDIS